MPSAPLCKLIIGAWIWGLMVSCAAGIPLQIADQVSWNLSFTELRREPEAYRGRVVALGGLVAHIEATDEGYRLVVHELPFKPTSQYRPAVDQVPRGRFIVLIPRQSFPSDLRPGAEITVVGEILGQATAPEAGIYEGMPVLDARYVRMWGPSWWPGFQIGVWGGIGI